MRAAQAVNAFKRLLATSKLPANLRAELDAHVAESDEPNADVAGATNHLAALGRAEPQPQGRFILPKGGQGAHGTGGARGSLEGEEEGGERRSGDARSLSSHSSYARSSATTVTTVTAAAPGVRVCGCGFRAVGELGCGCG